MNRRPLPLSLLVAVLLVGSPADAARARGHAGDSSPAAGAAAGAAELVALVVGADGSPLAGAEATLRPARSGALRERWRQWQEEAAAGPTATSDDEGLLAFTAPPPGRYDLHVTAAGHVPLRVPGIEVPAAAARIDLGGLRLAAATTLSGRVIDTEGRPLRGVRVEAWATDPLGFGSLVRVASDSTGADGRFGLRDLEPGRTVELRLYGEGLVPGDSQPVQVPHDDPLVLEMTRGARLAGQLLDDSGNGVAGRLIVEGDRLGASTQTEEDGRFALDGVATGTVRVRGIAAGFLEGPPVVLELAPGERRDDVRLVLEPGGTLVGRVTGREGEPIPDAAVEVVAEQPDERFRGLTDGEGRYRLTGLPAGRIEVRVDHPEHAATRGEATIGASDAHLDLTLGAGFEVSGRVVDEHGEPVAGAEVFLAERPWYSFEEPVRTDADGSFRFSGVAPGTWLPRAEKEGLLQAEPDLRVEVTASLAGAEIRMRPGAAIVGRIEGLEPDEVGRLQVMAEPRGRIGPWPAAVVGSDGSYRIAGAGPGTWRVQAQVDAGRRATEGTVEIAAGEREARLDLDLGGRLVLSGRATLGGEPLPGAMVWLTRLGGADRAQATAGRDGRFRLDGLHAGRYGLMLVNVDPGLLHHREIELVGDGEVSIELTEHVVAGRVVDAETGAPLAAARVHLVPAGSGGGGERGVHTTGADGAFRLPRVAPGDYLLHAGREGHAHLRRELTVAGEGDVTGLELALQPAHEALIEVTSPAGVPRPREVRVTVVDPAAADPPDAADTFYSVASGAVRLDADGRGRLDGVPPGRWLALVSAPVMALATIELTVPGPAAAVSLAPQASVRLDVSGVEVPARLRLLAADGRPFPFSFGDGSVRAAVRVPPHLTLLDGLPAGRWTVEVTAEDGRTWSGAVEVLAGEVGEVVLAGEGRPADER